PRGAGRPGRVASGVDGGRRMRLPRRRRRRRRFVRPARRRGRCALRRSAQPPCPGSGNPRDTAQSGGRRAACPRGPGNRPRARRLGVDREALRGPVIGLLRAMKIDKRNPLHWWYLVLSGCWAMLAIAARPLLPRRKPHRVLLYGHKLGGNLLALYQRLRE